MAVRARHADQVAMRPLLRLLAVALLLAGDASAEIPKLMSNVRDLLANLTAMTAADAPLNHSLRSVQTTTERLNGKTGASSETSEA